VLLPPHVAVVHSAKVPLQTVKGLGDEAADVATAAGVDAIADVCEAFEAGSCFVQEKRHNEPDRIPTTAAFLMSISPLRETVSVSSAGVSYPLTHRLINRGTIPWPTRIR
jgi:hypothetical protein